MPAMCYGLRLCVDTKSSVCLKMYKMRLVAWVCTLSLPWVSFTIPGTAVQPPIQNADVVVCNGSALSFHLSDPPYDDYFYSDCRSASQVVVTSPLSDSNLTIIGPRLLVRNAQ
jgi:hypothetical protein